MHDSALNAHLIKINDILIKNMFLFVCYRIQAELLKNESADIDLDAVSKITAQDFEDASTEELSKFKFADIVTGNY